MYKNPIIEGFYPDPSICKKDNNYYLVTSSFEYFPGVPIFKSDDLINWKQIGHCLTRESQLNLKGCKCSHGVFAPTIRYYNEKFYMITTSYAENEIKVFYVFAENPEDEWSDPIYLDIEGIDPSIFCDEGKTYVQYSDYCQGIAIIKQVEIEIDTGRLINSPKVISYGCGGRDVEAPHIFKRNQWYYLMLAEGGTREGHMVTLSRSTSVWGPFEPCPYNPILTNRDKAKEVIQCVGHGDLIEDDKGISWIVALGTRPIKHHTNLGRETMLTPAIWTKDEWLKSKYGFMPLEVEVDMGVIQRKNNKYELDLEKKQLPLQLVSLRKRISNNIIFKENLLEIKGNEYTLDDLEAVMFLGFRQKNYNFKVNAIFGFNPKNYNEKAGLAIVADNDHYVEMVETLENDKKVIVVRKKIADVITEKRYILSDEYKNVSIKISGTSSKYYFSIKNRQGNWEEIDSIYIKHFSNECSNSPFTGVVIGMYVTGDNSVYCSKLEYTDYE